MMEEQRKQTEQQRKQTAFLSEALLGLHDDAKPDYAQLIYERSITDRFVVRFPNDTADVFEYFTRIDLYKTRNPNVMTKHLFQNVIKTLPRSRLTEWMNYRNKQLSDRTDAHPGFDILSEKQQTQYHATYLLDICRFDTYKNWILSIFTITADHTTFDSLFQNINIRYHESPKALFRRLLQYFDQIRNIITLLNRTTYRYSTYKAADLTLREKFKILYRIYVTNNWNKTYNNYGKHNEKIRINLLKGLKENGYEYDAIAALIKEQDTKIIPLEIRNDKIEKYHWHKYPYDRNESSIFLISRSPTTPKRKRYRENTADGPPVKKQRFTSNPPCKNGSNCSRYIESGRCTFFHTTEEMRNLYQQRKKYLSNQSKNYTTDKYKNTVKPENKRDYKPNCRNGAECRSYQEGRCRFYHKYKDMKCGKCGKTGHAAFKCYTKSTKTNVKDEKIPHYDPTNSVNATKSLRELQNYRNSNKLSDSQNQKIFALVQDITRQRPRTPKKWRKYKGGKSKGRGQ